jgi:tRNA (guanine-N7-)-methyltransferase
MAAGCCTTFLIFTPNPGIGPELHIKTHYESLDIAQSKRVHYLCFSLPATLPSKELDAALQQLLKDEGELD